MRLFRLQFQSINQSKAHKMSGFTLIEMVVSILALAIAGTMVLEVTNSTTKAMNNMKKRSKIDSAIAAHLEIIRDRSFRLLCTNGCDSGELNQELTYNETTLIPLCDGNQGNGLGNLLLTDLNNEGLNPTSFNVQDYDPTAESMSINSTIVEDSNNPNAISVTISSSELSKQISTTIIPNAQRWCP